MDRCSSPVSTEALGRPFSLGMLYDSRSDRLVPGVSLWESDALNKNVQRHPMQHSKMHIVASDSICDKANALHMSGELKVSFLGGFVTVNGAGSYFNDCKESPEIVRVTLKYESNSHFDQLSMGHLGRGNYRYPEVFDNHEATHVVTGIEYGADAFFVFEKATKSSSTANSRKLQGELQAAVKSMIVQIDAAGTGGCADLKSYKTEDTESITCNFYGDFQLDTIPTTYKEAWEVIVLLPQVLKTNPAVPKRVHLYPLCNLDSRAAVLMRSISEYLIDRVEHICQQTVHFRAQVTALSKSPAVAVVPFLQQELNDYKRILNLSSAVFATKLLTLIPLVRGGNEEEKKLATMLNEWERSLTAPRNLQSVLAGIKTTVTFVNNQIIAANEQGVQGAFDSNLDQITSDINKDFIVCFTLNWDVLSSKGLMTIDKHLHDNNYTSGELPKEWHNSDQLKSIMRDRFRLFLEYAKVNKDGARKIEYVITDGLDLNSPDESVIVQVFEGGQETIKLATAPGIPILIGETTTTEACIEWKGPKEGKDSIKSYLLWYSIHEENNWKSFDTDGDRRCHIERLRPGMEYVFKVQATTRAGLSPSSPVSEPVVMKIEETLAMRMLQQCRLCEDTNKEVEMYTPKNRYNLSYGQRVKKYEIGVRCLDRMREKTILVVGATGTGKTTFLNSMFNYLTGIRLTDDFRFKLITQEDEGQESAQSITKNVTAYVLHETILPYTLTVVDTPGYGDTEGLKADKSTTNLIKQLFEAKRDVGGIDQLDAVCLVVKSTDSRLTSHQLYNFNSVLALFSADMADNVMIIVTFCDASTPPVILALKEGKVPYYALYKFNNSAFFEGKRGDRFGNAAQHLYWELGQTNFEAFFRGLEMIRPKSLTLSVEVLNKREQLENLVLHLKQQVNSGMNDLETMRQEAMVMEQYQAKIKANENFTYSVTEEKAVKVEISGDAKQHTTTCMNCSYTCHENCWVAKDENKWWCCAFDMSGNCRVCPQKCTHIAHRNKPFIFDIITVEVVKTDEELRRKYAECQGDFQEKEKLMSNLGEQFYRRQRDIDATVKLIRDSMMKLKEIAMRPDHLTDVDYIEALIQSEKLQKKPGWQKRVYYLMDQKDIAQKYEQSKDPKFDYFHQHKQDKGNWKTNLQKIWQYGYQ